MAHDHDVERWSHLKAFVYALFGNNPKNNRAIVEHAEIGPGDRILDIGCGPGAALEHASRAGAEVFGVDPSPAMVQRASHRVPGATVVEGSAEELPFPDDDFTHVWNVASFHHWAHAESGLAESKRVLAPGGRFFVVERALREGKDGHGLNPKEADQVAAKLTELGFTDSVVSTLAIGRSDYLVVSGTA